MYGMIWACVLHMCLASSFDAAAIGPAGVQTELVTTEKWRKTSRTCTIQFGAANFVGHDELAADDLCYESMGLLVGEYFNAQIP